MCIIYPAIITQFGDGSGYTVEFPDLPGCITEGSNLIEAIETAEDAASGWVLDELEAGKAHPAPSSPSEISTEPGSLVSLIILDLASYSEKHGTKAVRRNITIPA